MVKPRGIAWQYVLPRACWLAAIFAGSLLVRDHDTHPLEILVALAIGVGLTTFALRTVASMLVRRLFATVAGVAYVLLVLGGPSRWGPIALAAGGTLLLAKHHIGSLSARYLGVPRPDLITGHLNPTEGTSDDAARLVDALDRLWGSTREGGPRAGRRAAHADGSGARGRFAPSRVEDSTFEVPLFTECGELDALVRFSNFWGWGRDDSRRTPRGMAVRLTPMSVSDRATPRRAGMDLVLLDARRFPVNSRDDLYGLIARFRRWHRIAIFILFDRTRLRALIGAVAIRRPTSYTTRRYHGINTFLWQGEPVRFLMTPRRHGPKQPRDIGDQRWRLDRDLRRRLAGGGTAGFELWIVWGRRLPHHLLLDARLAWPRFMPKCKIGTLTLTDAVTADDVDSISFDPHNLPEGVEPSADEILMARRAAHAESRLRRCPI